MSASIVRGLEIFCALIETGSATAAAQRLRLSQPAVSQQISRLETDLKLTLFVRENGRMRPTEMALSLYEEANHALDGMDRVINLARDIRSLDRGLLRVAAPYSAAADYLPRALKHLTAEHKHLRVIVHLGTYERIIGLVAARDVDIGISKAPVLAPGVESVDIDTSRLVAVLPKSSPLTQKPIINFADLSHTPLVMIGRGRPWRDEIDVAFRQEGIAIRVAVETQSVESACGFAAEGFGVAIVPEWLTGSTPKDKIVIAPLNIDIEHKFLVVYPARTKRHDLAKDFAAACRKARTEMSETTR